MYELFSSVASFLGPPHARSLSRCALKLSGAIAPTAPPGKLQRSVMGLTFPGPVGLAAGYDRHGELFPWAARLGFGFAEIGSAIPKAEAERSRGLETVISHLSRYAAPHPIPLGVSISMNRDTPSAKIHEDYLLCMEKLWPLADYLTINLGVRAGPDLHQPENRETLLKVLQTAKETQSQLMNQYGVRRPLLVKVDQERRGADALLDSIASFALDGIVLSGESSWDGRKLANLERMAKLMPVVAVGGIRTPQDAANRLSAGASLIQIYSGIVKSGPMLPRRINSYLETC